MAVASALPLPDEEAAPVDVASSPVDAPANPALVGDEKNVDGRHRYQNHHNQHTGMTINTNFIINK